MTYKGITYQAKETPQGWKVTIGTEVIDGLFPTQDAAEAYARQWIENPPPFLKDL